MAEGCVICGSLMYLYFQLMSLQRIAAIKGARCYSSMMEVLIIIHVVVFMITSVVIVITGGPGGSRHCHRVLCYSCSSCCSFERSCGWVVVTLFV